MSRAGQTKALRMQIDNLRRTIRNAEDEIDSIERWIDKIEKDREVQPEEIDHKQYGPESYE